MIITKFKKRLAENRNVPKPITGLLFTVLTLLVLVVIFKDNISIISNQKFREVPELSNQSPQPTSQLIECFIKGESVMATREVCQQLSKQQTSMPSPIYNTPIIKQPTSSIQPTPTSTQRVSIYVVSLNQTANCRQQNEASARDLANKIDQAYQEQQKCFDDRRKAFSECASSKTNCIDLDAKWNECTAIGDKRSQMIDALNQMCK